MKKVVFTLALGIIVLCLSYVKVWAGDDACPSGQSCYPQRVINQWACSTCTPTWNCGGDGKSCSINPITGKSTCGEYDGDCMYVCPAGNFTSTCYSTGTTIVDCNNTGAYNCSFDTASYKNCHDSGGSGSCKLPYEVASFGCCGPGGSTTVGCGGSCSTSANCNAGLTCSSGVCRNVSCPAEASCNCGDDGGDTYSCSGVTITGPAVIAPGQTATYTLTVNESNGTHDGLTLIGAGAGGTVTPTSIGTAPYTFTGATVGAVTLTATASRAGANVCTGTLPITVAIPQVTVLTRACNSTNMLTCVTCDEPVGFAGSFRLGATSNAVTGNNVATFTNVDGGTAASVIELSTTDTDWTLFGAAKSYPAGTWPTAGTTYGPYNHCVTKPKLLGSRV